MISIREDVWARAEAGDGRARFTCAHELGHSILHFAELRDAPGHALFRDRVCTAREKLPPGVRIFESPEWQANKWASAFLMPITGIREFVAGRDETDDECGIEEIAGNFKVSVSAARVRLAKVLPALAAHRSMRPAPSSSLPAAR